MLPDLQQCTGWPPDNSPKCGWCHPRGTFLQLGPGYCLGWGHLLPPCAQFTCSKETLVLQSGHRRLRCLPHFSEPLVTPFLLRPLSNLKSCDNQTLRIQHWLLQGLEELCLRALGIVLVLNAFMPLMSYVTLSKGPHTLCHIFNL